MAPGERWNAAKYDEMNQAFQDQTLEHLRDLAGRDEPFFLQYWPLIPLDNTRAGRKGPESPNGGLYADKLQLLDQWLGEIFAEMESLGVADNTLVVVMGDNGHFTKYSPQSGFTPMVFRGGKADTTEGGIRVDCLHSLAGDGRGRHHDQQHFSCLGPLYDPGTFRGSRAVHPKRPTRRRCGPIRLDSFRRREVRDVATRSLSIRSRRRKRSSKTS